MFPPAEVLEDMVVLQLMQCEEERDGMMIATELQ